ncbi:MAG: bifunctional aspartate kinase/homoserine dehydrogenase I [Acidobacteriota bacterium]
MLVMKFGGTSVGDAARMRHVARLVLAERNQTPVVVVTSAMTKVTDALIAVAHAARDRNSSAVEAGLGELRRRHIEAAEALTDPGARREALLGSLRELLMELEQVCHGIRLLSDLTPRSLDLVSSFGERLAAPLVAAAIRTEGGEAEPFDARLFVRTDAMHGSARTDETASRALTRQALLPHLERLVPVVTGFIGATQDGVTTTLGRGGSDLSGALMGAFLDAEAIWIWSDVDGVLTADPRVVPEARLLTQVSYREAAEMAYFGSKVLHPGTIAPAVRQQIPIVLKNSFRPESTGTVVGPATESTAGPVKTVSSIADLALVTVEGNGMVGVPGIAARCFGAAARAGVNVYLISQASSEHNISFVCKRSDGRRVVAELEREFELERMRSEIESIDVKEPVGIVAIIGEGMRGIPGVSQAMFTALGRAGINVQAIAQGSSELNISAVVDECDIARAVGAIHTRFGLTRDIHVFLLGKGLVGRTLLRQLLKGRQRLVEHSTMTVRVIGVAGRNQMLFDPHGLDDTTLTAIADGAALDTLGAQPRPSDSAMIEIVAGSRRLDVALLDMTAEETGPLHRAALQAGLHVVTANKKPVAGPGDVYREIRALSRRKGLGYHFETTFGAGLPLLSTLQDLVATRDEVDRISGCLSGTLGFVCSRLMQGQRFSEIVREAKSLGYTEPDPRDDLSGVDVARKALIIAREIGMTLEMSEIALVGLVTPELMALPSVGAFMESLPRLDAPMAERVDAARRNNAVLRFVAEIRPASVDVGLREIPLSSPLAQLDGPDNLLVFRTERYSDNPLVIRGPGAGAEVTAAGVYGDILKIGRGL